MTVRKVAAGAEGWLVTFQLHIGSNGGGSGEEGERERKRGRREGGMEEGRL